MCLSESLVIEDCKEIWPRFWIAGPVQTKEGKGSHLTRSPVFLLQLSPTRSASLRLPKLSSGFGCGDGEAPRKCWHAAKRAQSGGRSATKARVKTTNSLSQKRESALQLLHACAQAIPAKALAALAVMIHRLGALTGKTFVEEWYPPPQE